MASTNVEFRCFVHGFDRDTDEKNLKKAFSKFGNIVYDHVTGRSKRFGFVTFEDEKSMREAIKGMNGGELDGFNITVSVARPRRLSYWAEFAQEFAIMLLAKQKIQKKMAGL